MTDKNVLLLVDFQHGFLKDEHTRSLRPTMQQLVSDPRFQLVVAMRFLNRPGSLWNRVIGWNGLMCAEDQELAVALPPHSLVIDKEAYGLPADSVSNVLSLMRNSAVFIAGIETDVCVSIIAAQLFDHGVAPYILTPYTASTRGEEHTKHALLTLSRIVGTAHLIDSLNAISTTGPIEVRA